MAGICAGTVIVNPVYAEASLVSCQLPAGAVEGQITSVLITVNPGTVTESYKLVFSGDIIGESAPFTVVAGAGQQQFTIEYVITISGIVTVTASLVKV